MARIAAHHRKANIHYLSTHMVHQATKPEYNRRQEAVNRELSSLAEKGVYQELLESEVPEGKNHIPTKWVFDYKRDSEGSVIDHKARWVAKGFYQNPGIDYGDTYAPTMQDSTLRLLCSMQLNGNWPSIR